ncbi:hypothetical protein LO80_08720 [Candidatus Francisella endociliophora]|uniref:Pentapeptide repeat-containing protein n=1 Tax=Candidatus Francisella endociliophora TaxID=653937 RepID=A0A097ERZ1_9GAMM|nr:pentapeptide repeat-containing protein [Francisella sp. FSC1006]AIT10334.1 hypothetical protein LO80_08720 [Francisella sp. FSC1006]
MNDEAFRNHLVDITFKDSEEAIFKVNDDIPVIGKVDGNKLTIPDCCYKALSGDYYIISFLEQLEKYINNIPVNKDSSAPKIISYCVFRNQNIIDEILDKYSDKDIRFVHCFFIFSGVIRFNINNEKKSIWFGNCYFKGQLELSGELKRLSFMLSDFLGIVKFKIIKIYNIQFNDCVLNKSALFPGKLKKLSRDSLLSVESCIFKDMVKMQYFEYELDISFQKTEFLKDVYLDVVSKFLGKLVFVDVQFYGKANLSYSMFEKNVIFKNVAFKNNIDISYAEFLNVVDFSSSKFQKMIADNTKFHKDSIFEGTTFSNLVDFKYTTFKENSSLRAAHFIKGLNLARVNINNSAILDFHDAEVNNGNSYQISIKDKQETCRILKHESLKKNDTIKAVEFYKDECESHYQTLKWDSRDFFNKFILAFEKYVSNYGTSIFRSIVSLVLINIMFVVLTLLKPYLFTTCLFLLSIFIGYLSSFDKHSSILNKMVYFTFSIIISYVILKLGIFTYQIFDYLTFKSTRFLPIDGSKGVSFATLIHIAINATLVYEIIKSFRKYSRKL